MKGINEFNADIARDIAELREAAQQGVRVLADMELGWIAGGDNVPNWTDTPPTP